MNLVKFVKSFVQTAKDMQVRHVSNVEGVEYCPVDGYKKGNTPPTDGWMPYSPLMPLKGHDAHFWLRVNLKTPAATEREQIILRTSTGKEGKWDAINPQGLVYLNGKMVQGLDTHHTDVFLDPDTDYTIHNYFYVGMIDEAVNCDMKLCVIDRPLEQLYYDVVVPFDSCELMKPDSDAYVRMMSVLVEAIRLTDLRDPYSEEYYRSIEDARAYLAKHLYGELCSKDGKPVVHCVGHTHIDVEWRWARAQTREKIQRSFSTAKSLMDRYPEYQFMLSQPELYRYLKEEAPERYEELCELVKAGRWEPEGAMYLEADCNLTSGESLVRQILAGKRFFKKEFGVDSRILFLPDVFGYSAAMPQILKKSGVDYFVTSKISWNDTNMMPMDEFMWEGIDGTDIFTCFITAQKYSPEGKNGTTYVGHATPSEIKGTWHRFQQKEFGNRALTTFGFGDGGGGPTAEMLETLRRLSYGLPDMPVARITTLREYLDTAKAQFDEAVEKTSRMPRWVGELYLEYHRGTYTSVAKVKKGNRMAEWTLGNLEALSATDLSMGGTYDHAGLEKYWRKTLHNQFHDILPGSSIGEVYDGTDVDYAQIQSFGENAIKEKLEALSARIDAKRDGIMLYNPTGFARRAAFVGKDGYVETDETVPAFGWHVIEDTKSNCRAKIDGLVAENDYYILRMTENGQIASLYDKRVGREVLKKGSLGNVLKIFEDRPTKYDAWEIEDHYPLKSYTIDGEAEVRAVRDGSRVGFAISRSYMKSVIRQTIWLYSNSTRIDFETDLDWHEKNQLLKAEFPFDVHAMNATYDVQFGHVSRPTHQNTSWDSARFETYAHKWMDLSECGYGVSMLSDTKYGYGTNGSTVTVTLLKCATFPDPNADQGAHHFVYSLMPHVGDFREAGVIEESYALNQPLLQASVAAKGKGDLPTDYSFVSCDSRNIVITAVKKAEDDDGIIIRFYDAHDCKSNVTIQIPNGYTHAYVCDLMENVERELPVENGSVRLPVSNFEIVTLKLGK